MKHLVVGLAAMAVLASSCKKSQTKGGQEKEVASASGETTSYVLDSAQSVINWQGYSVASGEEGGHYGTIHFQSNGEFSVKDSVLTAGSFTVGMNSVKVTDIEDETKRNDLEVHLKNEDFFETNNFPIATFEITKVTTLPEGDFNTEIEGNFKIKDSTKSYKFKANTAETDSTYTIKTEEFRLNRQDFGVNYQTTMKDVLIKDDIQLQIDITGKKK